MLGRLFIVTLVAAGALCCPFHCLHHQADAVAFFVNRMAGHGDPADAVAPPSPVGEQNESGCICRGAFFVDAPTVVPIDLAKWCPLLQDSTPLLLTAQLDAPGEFLTPADLLWRPPQSGKTLRALHSSFLF
jgi:hypothetical protein